MLILPKQWQINGVKLKTTMHISEIIHLFTPLTDKLPRREEHVLCITKDYLTEYIVLVDKFGKVREGVTHWLDLSILMRQEYAKELLEELKLKLLLDLQNI